MAIATSTALLIGAGIAGGASVYAASKQAGAAQQAGQQQAQSNQQALQLAQQIYQQNQQNLRPYMQTGGAASSTLQQLMGLPGATGNLGPNGFLPPGATATGPGYTYNPSTGGVTITDLGTSVLMPGAQGRGQQALNQMTPNQRLVTGLQQSPLGTMFPGANWNSLQSRLDQQFPAQATASQSVTMRAPDGTIRQVPASQVNQALANGGQVIG